MAPSIWYFDDKFLSFAFSKSTIEKLHKHLNMEKSYENSINVNSSEDKEVKTIDMKRPSLRNIIHVVIGCLIAYLSVPIVVNLASSQQAMNRSFDPFRIVNTYGAFGRYHVNKS